MSEEVCAGAKMHEEDDRREVAKVPRGRCRQYQEQELRRNDDDEIAVEEDGFDLRDGERADDRSEKQERGERKDRLAGKASGERDEYQKQRRAQLHQIERDAVGGRRRQPPPSRGAPEGDVVHGPRQAGGERHEKRDDGFTLQDRPAEQRGDDPHTEQMRVEEGGGGDRQREAIPPREEEDGRRGEEREQAVGADLEAISEQERLRQRKREQPPPGVSTKPRPEQEHHEPGRDKEEKRQGAHRHFRISEHANPEVENEVEERRRCVASREPNDLRRLVPAQ